MARYHGEHEKAPEERVKSKKTLSREFWKGQLHGSGLGRKPIHATHMRSRCSVIPRGKWRVSEENGSAVLSPSRHTKT